MTDTPKPLRFPSFAITKDEAGYTAKFRDNRGNLVASEHVAAQIGDVVELRASVIPAQDFADPPTVTLESKVQATERSLFAAIEKHALTVTPSGSFNPHWVAYNHDHEGRGETPEDAVRQAIRRIENPTKR